MAGTGIASLDLTRQATLSGGLSTYLRAGIATCGPWIFTVLAIAGVNLLQRTSVEPGEVALFMIIIIYNFIFSLLLASPVVLAVARRLADEIYAARAGSIPGLLFGALTLLFVLQSAVAIPYYGFIVGLDLTIRLLAIVGFFTVGGIWIASAFLAALKRYGTVSLAFAVGMGIAFILAAAFRSEGTVGLLAGFTLGLALIFFFLLGRIVADFPASAEAPWQVLAALRQYWEYALAGLFYVAGIWVDKWIMWSAPGNLVFAGAMPAHPAYDAALFLAFLSIIPAMAVFFLCMETQFFRTYRRFYRDIGDHATLDRIETNHTSILLTLKQVARRIILLQTTISYVLILLAPQLIELAGGGSETAAIFRFAVIGALFHVMVVFIMMVLSYFDLARLLLRVAASFLLLNAVFTGAALSFGPSYYGYGYLLASILCLVYAYRIAAGAITRLAYMTFVANNKALH